MDGGGLEEDFGGAGPDHDLTVGFGFEFGDVVADLVGEVTLVLADFLVLGGEALDVMLVEGGGHGLDGLEEGLHRFELVAVEDLRGAGGVVEIAAEDIPSGEDEVVELGDGGEVFNEGRVVVGSLAEADGSHLGDGADGFCEAAADCFYAGDEGGCYGSHSWDHDAKFSGGRLDAGRRLRCGGGVRHAGQYPSMERISVGADSSSIAQ